MALFVFLTCLGVFIGGVVEDDQPVLTTQQEQMKPEPLKYDGNMQCRDHTAESCF